MCFGVQAPVKERFLKLHRRDYIMVGNGRIRRCKKCVLTFKSIGRSVSMSAGSKVSKVATLQNLGVPDPAKVRRSRLRSAEIDVFIHIFFTKLSI